MLQEGDSAKQTSFSSYALALSPVPDAGTHPLSRERERAGWARLTGLPPAWGEGVNPLPAIVPPVLEWSGNEIERRASSSEHLDYVRTL